MSFRFLLSAGALLCAITLPAGLARASYDPVAAGTTQLTLDKGFARLLGANGVAIAAKAGARRRGRSLLLPAAGGSIDPTLGKGEVESAGTLVFERGRRTVVVRNIVVKTKPEPLVAKVGGSQLKVASAPKAEFVREGFRSRVSAGPLRLTAKFATRLGKKLRLHGVFSAGQVLGALRSEAQPRTVAVVPQGRATLTPDPAFLAKLDGLFVSLNPISPAERTAGPLFTLPLIPAGTIAPDGASGVVRTGGALEFLQLSSGQVFWQELWFDLAGHQVLAEADLEPTPTFSGKVGQEPIASLSGGSVSSNPKTRTVDLAGPALALTESAAAQLNQVLAGGKGVFSAGERLGSITVNLRGE